MGVMICKVHDRVDFVETCSHVAQRLDQRQVPSGHRLTILGNLFICEECFEALGFARFASLVALPLEDAVEVEDGRRNCWTQHMNVSRIEDPSA